MYPVTNPFKSAVYSSSRQFKAKTRFEIIDVNAYPDATPTVNAEAEFSKFAQTVNIKRETSAKYATFETDYWLLDGSFGLPPKAVESGYEVGWLSNALSGTGGTFTTSPELTVQFTQNHSSIGITVTFDTLSNEYASDFSIKAYNSVNALIKTVNVTNNTDAIYLCEEGFSNYRKIVLTITKWNKADRRARLLELDFGIVKEYTDDKIVKLNVLEELDTLSSTVSSNEATLTLYNDNQEFNILNPNGIYPYLQRRQRIVPYYGLVITDTLTEYVPMGVYYLNDWKSDEGTMTATFTARDILDLLAQSIYRKGKYQSRTLYNLAVDVLSDANVTDYEIDTALQGITVNGYIPLVSHREALQLIGFAGQCVVYSDRNGYIQIKRLASTALNETLDFDNVYKSPSIKLDKLVNTIDVNVNKYVAKATSEEVYNGTIAINGTVDVWITYKSMPCQSVSSVVTGGTVNSATYYGNAALLNITAAGNVTIVSTGTILEKASTVYTLQDGTAPADEQMLSLSVDNLLITDNTIAGDVATWILTEYQKRFLYDVNWRQNPALEAGDIVTVEDEFAENKAVRITKQNFEYQGYLSGKTEGRGG